MIEARIKNELTLRRWRRFKANRRAVAACWILVLLIILSLTAELWANDKPLILSYQNQGYYPIFKFYHPTVFGRTDILQMDYRTLSLSEGDWAIWPPIRWGPFERNDHVDEWPSPPTAVNLMGTD
ncbi:MAG: peptide ABC transporter permease, partial [Candidatus Tectomicrobia bacterium]|nr:peptide ABC transporter permease [Candidatus Tectomicrobia bacterium]